MLTKDADATCVSDADFHCASETESGCTSGQFTRLNYFHGMLLTERDFQDEQAYVRKKLQLHNRLHGHGVVCGLDLQAKYVKVENDSVSKIFIEPGMALDCAGNEIVVYQPHRVDIEAKIRALHQQYHSLDPLPKLYVGIKYCECKSEPKPQYASECIDDQLQPAFSRIREGYSVEIFTEDELPENAQRGDADDDPDTDRACLELSGCCGNEWCVIILGCVEEYLSEELHKGNPDLTLHSFTNEMIDRCCKPPYVSGGAGRWEQYKQAALDSACHDFGWVHLSETIGESESIARQCLIKKGCQDGNIQAVLMTDIPAAERSDLVKRMHEAPAYADPGSKIELIMDKRDCVLLALSS